MSDSVSLTFAVVRSRVYIAQAGAVFTTYANYYSKYLIQNQLFNWQNIVSIPIKMLVLNEE